MDAEGGDRRDDEASATPPANADGGQPTASPAEAAGAEAPATPPAERPTGAISQPPDDVEMPLTDHIEEMLSRLTIVAVLGGLATVIAYPFAGDIVTTMWYDIHPGTVAECVADPQAQPCAPPHVYGPLDLVLTEIKVAALAGILVALPALVYQTYQFMRPGLYPHERRYYLASVPMSLVLALVGMAFAYFVILPILFTVFLHYSEGSAEVAFALRETFDLLLMMLTTLALVFQIPLFLMLAIMMGVTTREWLESRRIYFWIGFSGVAFVFSPDPTGMAPFVVAVTMIALFEGTLAMLRWSAEGVFSPSPRQLARVRPIAWLVAALVGYLASPAPLPEGLYGQLPPAVTDALADAGVEVLAAVAVMVAAIASFEGGRYLLRRWSVAPRLRVVLRQLRVPVWATAIALGYLTTPEPVLLDELEVVLLEPLAAVALGLAIGLTYELVLAGWRWVRPDPSMEPES